MSEKYKLIDILRYVNKENKEIYLACVYIVKGGNNAIKNIVIKNDDIPVLEQYLYKDVSDLLLLEYNTFKNEYQLKFSIN